MYQKLEELDKSMASLYLNLMKYPEYDPHYKEILSTLAQQYQTCSTLMALTKDGININRPYCFKYAYIENIKSLLTNAGYLEQAPKAKH